MKRALLIGACLVGISASAQYVFSPAKHLDTAISATAYHNIDIYFEPPSPRAITYHWKLIENTLPQDWTYSLCDYGGCYAGAPDSGSMTPISQQEAMTGTKGFFTLTINANASVGSGNLILLFYDSANPQDADTASYTVHHTATVGINELETSAVQIFPNPSSGLLNLNKTKRLMYQLYSMEGKFVEQGVAQGEINFQHIPKGKYLLSIIDDKNRQVLQLILQ